MHFIIFFDFVLIKLIEIRKISRHIDLKEIRDFWNLNLNNFQTISIQNPVEFLIKPKRAFFQDSQNRRAIWNLTNRSLIDSRYLPESLKLRTEVG